MLDELKEKKYELKSYNSLESAGSSYYDEPELSPGERMLEFMTRDRS
jgi:hypothetical protein